MPPGQNREHPKGHTATLPRGHRVPAKAREWPSVDTLLAAAVAGIGGTARPGQAAMAAAVKRAIDTGEHLAVQAGTGTGKSLAYLVPAAAHGAATGATVVVATATIALQRQLTERDLPRLATALQPLLDREPTFAILKGRRNYLCLHRLNAGAPEEPGETLFDPGDASVVGRQVRRLHEWAASTETGDRDELIPGVDERAWRQVAVSARECLGAPRCPFGAECFAERAREVAGQVDIVVTNHALLAIDALEEFPVLPEHDVVIIDEAHDLVNRVTSAASAELSAAGAESAARRGARVESGDSNERLKQAGEAFGRVIAEMPAGRIDALAEPLAASLAALRDAAAACAADIRASTKENAEDAERLAVARAALSSLDDVREVANRVLGAFGAEIAARPDVVWMDRPLVEDSRHPPTLRVAPLDVGGLLAQRLFRRRTVVLTSATLALGGSFEPLARKWGLPPEGSDLPAAAGARREPGTRGAADPGAAAARNPAPEAEPGPGAAAEPGAGAAAKPGAGAAAKPGAGAAAEPGAGAAAKPGAGAAAKPRAGAAGRRAADEARNPWAELDDEPGSLVWSGVDVGSPFDHPRSGILYVARHLPPPGRDRLPEPYLTELRELIIAAGGRTLGLFSSMRAARQAAEELRDAIGPRLLCQGDDATAQLVREFADDEESCLFGTLSLWQGVDVPGPSLRLVVIDRIPFPRPDDPLASARQRAVAARGGNGFMTVAAAHAALLLAQGAGRLLRRTDDKGMVAILDPRLVTARYGGFLRASLPPFWATTDAAVARAALRRLAEQRQ